MMKYSSQSPMNRRRFLGHCGTAALATGVLPCTLPAYAAPTQDVSGYKALVCVLLAGGADSYNMLVPRDNTHYQRYESFRADLALSANSLLPLEGDFGGRQYGVHPGLSGVASAFNNGTGAWISDCGLLVEPTSDSALTSGTAKYPLGLYSHADQIAQWQTSIPDGRGSTGVAGRIADRLAIAANGAGTISMNISLGGSNIWQTGREAVEYAINATGTGSEPLVAYNDPDAAFLTAAIDGLLGNNNTLWGNEYSRRLRGAIDAGFEFGRALTQADETPLQTRFSTNEFSAQMQMVARVINARSNLGSARQTFFVVLGGWDHHDEVLNNQARMLPMLDAGLTEFQAAMSEIGLADAVTTFTISDFGRTLTSNGRGSDHGWSGHQLVLGGAVNGGALYGGYPELIEGEARDQGRGVYAPTLATDEFYAELALWFGVASGDLDQVLPNIGRFYDAASNAPPLGFLRNS